MPGDPKYDVFISYSSKDKEWVRGELLKRIEQAGLKAFMDFRDFTRGAWSINEMTRAVTICRKTLLILTVNYLDSEWCEHERLILQILSAANRDLRLLPLLKTECDLPLSVKGINHIDFTDGADLDLAWRQLLTALGAAPELPQPKEPEHPDWYLAHPYPMPPNFTGRVSERGTLTRWLNEDKDHPLLVLRALGGFGKSALTWHWLTHDVEAKKWPRVVWWSFYEGDASFEHFVEETLVYLYSYEIKKRNLSRRDALMSLQDALQESGTLLVFDGFERVLRAFGGVEAAYQGDDAKHTDYDRDCVSPLAEHFLYNLALQPQLRSKVMLTTRLTPRIVEAKDGGYLQGCRVVELRQMLPEDAVAFFHAHRIRGTDTEIELACERYGYHPLSLRLLTGVIANDLIRPNDIAAAKRLDVSGDLVQRQHHVLEQAYDSLAPARQKLLGSVACFRWPVSYDTLKAAAESEDTLDRDLRELVIRGLLHHDVKERRFDLHPIVRHYAYDRLAAPDRAATHTRLRDYFAAVPEVEKVTRLEDLAPVIELYHHTVRAGQFDEASTFFRDRLNNTLYYQLGAYQLIIDLLRALFPDGEDRPPCLKDESDQGWTLNALANSYSLSGQPRRAVPTYEQACAIWEVKNDKRDLATGLGNVATQQVVIGALWAAGANLRRSIALCREIKDEFREAIWHGGLGRLLACRGADGESEAELATALTMFEKQNDVQSQCIVCGYRALRELLWLRTASQSAIRNSQSVIELARHALELADENARTNNPVERDYVRAHWLLGAAHRVAGQGDEAERHLHEALQRCRRINLVDTEADILIDLARLRAATGAAAEAQRLAEEARLIAERSGYVMQGADAHLELAKLALARGDQALAKEHATEARKLATCDGPPDYTYKAAYDEAGALLSQLG
jgi:tetratricopeptide (TPR) repeat protein